MKNYQCQTCGEGILLEPAEVEEHGAYCTEHMFSEQFPALDRLADQVSDKEEQRGNPRQETNRAAETETPIERNSVMDQSTAPEFWGYTTENFRLYHEDPETFHLRASSGPTVDQHALKRQETLRVRHTSGPTEEDEDYIDFHLYRHSINGEEINGKTLVAVDATSGQWLAQLDLARGNFKELAAWLSEEATR